MAGVSASVNLPLYHKVQKFSSATGSPGWSRKKGRKTVVVWCGITCESLMSVYVFDTDVMSFGCVCSLRGVST